MLEVHIRPEPSGGYRVEYNRVTQWFAAHAQAIAWAREVCPDCLVICYGADGAIEETYHSPVGGSEMAERGKRAVVDAATLTPKLGRTSDSQPKTDHA
jgi:hypothetical protein